MTPNIGDRRFECPCCGGRGEVRTGEVWQWAGTRYEPPIYEELTEPCEECDGTGWVDYEDNR